MDSGYLFISIGSLFFVLCCMAEVEQIIHSTNEIMKHTIQKRSLSSEGIRKHFCKLDCGNRHFNNKRKRRKCKSKCDKDKKDPDMDCLRRDLGCGGGSSSGCWRLDFYILTEMGDSYDLKSREVDCIRDKVDRETTDDSHFKVKRTGPVGPGMLEKRDHEIEFRARDIRGNKEYCDVKIKIKSKECSPLDDLTNGGGVKYLDRTNQVLGGYHGDRPIYGDRAEYTCATGFYLECRVGSEWTSDTSACGVRKCDGNPYDNSDGDWNECNENEREWSVSWTQSNEFRCTAYICPSSDLHSSTCDDTQYQGICNEFESCSEGFYRSGTATSAECLFDQTTMQPVWEYSGSPPDCLPLECSAASLSIDCPMGENCGFLDGACNAEFSSTCDFVCPEGYYAEPAFATCVYDSDSGGVMFDQVQANCSQRPDACFESDIYIQPRNGAIGCIGGTAYMACEVACSENYIYPIGGDNDFLCFDGVWLPMNIEDCYESPSSNVVQNIVITYQGDCSHENEDEIASQFAALFEEEFPSFHTETIVVLCGDIDRKKRSIYSLQIILSVSKSIDNGIDTPSSLEQIFLGVQHSLEELGVQGELLIGSPALQFESLTASELEYACESGHVLDVTLNCFPCTSGTYLNDVSGTCDPCEVGSYQNQVGQDHCISCPTNTSTLSQGSINPESCIESCLPGRFSTTGYAPCQLCPHNFYQSSRGQIECEPCPDNHGTQHRGSTSLSDCIADPCSPNPCYNDGSCVADSFMFTCSCQPGFTGRQCSIEIVNGVFGEWSEWSACSQSCDTGSTSRYRHCNNPAPLNGGSDCDGALSETQTCNDFICPECPDLQPPRNARVECEENTESDIVECVLVCLDGYTITFNAKNTARCGPSTNFEWAYREGHYSLPDCMEPEPVSEMALTQNVVVISSNPASASEIENAVENMENTIMGLLYCDDCIVRASMEEMDQFNGAVENRKKRQTNTDFLYYVLSYIIEVNVEGEDIETSLQYIDILGNLTEDINATFSNGEISITVGGDEAVIEESTFTGWAVARCSSSNLVYFDGNCVQCSRGTYIYGETCRSCPIGYYQDEEGQSSCIVCPDDTTTVTTRASNISHCIMPTEGMCSTGSYIDGDGCSACTLGQYQDQDNQASCIDCPLGEYQDFTGQTVCIRCPDGYMTSSTGSSSQQDCFFDFFACTAGDYMVDDECLPCPVGFYQPAAGQYECFQCPMGMTTEEEGAEYEYECYDYDTNETLCHAGSYFDGESCVPCSIGQYQPYHSQTNCFSCESGYTTEMEGATNVADCIGGEDEQSGRNDNDGGESKEQDDLMLIISVSVAGAILMVIIVIIIVAIKIKKSTPRQTNHYEEPRITESSTAPKRPGSAASTSGIVPALYENLPPVAPESMTATTESNANSYIQK